MKRKAAEMSLEDTETDEGAEHPPKMVTSLLEESEGALNEKRYIASFVLGVLAICVAFGIVIFTFLLRVLIVGGIAIVALGLIIFLLGR